MTDPDENGSQPDPIPDPNTPDSIENHSQLANPSRAPLRPSNGGWLQSGNPGPRKQSPRAAYLRRAKLLIQVRAANALDRRLRTEEGEIETRDLISIVRLDSADAADGTAQDGRPLIVGLVAIPLPPPVPGPE